MRAADPGGGCSAASRRAAGAAEPVRRGRRRRAPIRSSRSWCSCASRRRTSAPTATTRAATPTPAAGRRGAGSRTALARAHGLALATDWPMPVVGLDCYVMEVPASRRADEVAGQLSQEPGVDWAQADEPVPAAGCPRRSAVQLQPAAASWHLRRAARSGDRPRRAGRGDRQRRAARPSRPRRARSTPSVNLAGDRTYVGEDHGTAVAGIVAARADNRIGIAGVAPGARVLALRACRQQPGGERVVHHASAWPWR